MTPAARVAAAIEIIGEIDAHRRPASDLMREWGQSHRFAGSKDRSAIAGIVWDTLRVKSSAACSWMGRTPARRCLVRSPAPVASMFSAVSALCTASATRPRRSATTNASGSFSATCRTPPRTCRAIIPNGSRAQLAEAWGERAAEEGRALSQRAPVDLRANC